MSSVEDTEVFIPEQACVLTVPVRTLPSSITKKMSANQLQSNQLATFISPVELREKGMTQKSRTLTPGQFFLPVVTSNREAFRMLRNFLHSGENSLQFSKQKSRVGSAFTRKKNSIVLFNTEIFLIVRKDKMADLPLGQQSPTSSKCEAPPLNSPVKMQDGGSDVIEGQSEEGGLCGVEDNEEYAEIQSAADVVQCEAQDDNITAKTRCEDGPGPAEDHGKCAEVLKDKEEDELLMKDISTNTPDAKDESRYIKPEEDGGDVRASVAEAQSLLPEADGGEGLITTSPTENPNEELVYDQGCANELKLSVETHTGSEKSLSNNLKHGDDPAKDQAETVLHKQDSDVTCPESEANTKISEGESSVVKAKCCKRLIFSSPALKNSDGRQDKSDVGGQISELEIPSEKTETSVSAAEIVDVNANQVVHKNEDEANRESCGEIQTDEVQSSRCETPVELIDANDDDMISYVEDEVRTNSNRVEILLEKVESLKRRINDCVKGAQSNISKEALAETASDDDDDLIIVGVESVAARRYAEVMEVTGSTTYEPNRHTSDDKHYVNTTAAEPVCKVSGSKVEAKGCESAVEIIDLDSDGLSHKGKTDTNQLASGCKSRSDADSRSRRAVEIVDLDDYDDDDDDVILNDQEITNIPIGQIGDVVKGRKRKIFDGVADETGSDVTTVDLIGEPEGSSAKRSKDDDVNFSTDDKHLERDGDPKSQDKKDEQDVKVDDDDDKDDGADDKKDIDGCDDDDNNGGGNNNVGDDDIGDDHGNHKSPTAGDVECYADKTEVQRNGGNAEDPSDEVISTERDVPGDDIKSLLEKFKSRKRHLSDSRSADELHVGVETQPQLKESGEPSVKHFKSAQAQNPGGQTHENCTKPQSLLEIDDQNDHVKQAERLFPNVKCDVKMVPVHDVDEVRISELQSADEIKTSKAAAEIMDVHDDDPDRILPNVERCPKSHVNEVQNESPAQKEGATNDRERVSPSENAADEQNCDVTSDGVYSKHGDDLKHSDDPAITGETILHKQDSDTTCAERGAKTKINEGENLIAEAEVQRQDKSDLKVQICQSEIPADANEGGASCTESYVTIRTSEDRERSAVDVNNDDPVSDVISDDDDARFTTRPQVEEVGDSLHPASLPVEQEWDYMGLRREENISRIRARLRGMEEKLNTLINSRR